MNEQETLSLLGEDKYKLLYLPAKTNYIISTAQILGGGALLLLSIPLDYKRIVYRTQNFGLSFSRMTIHGEDPLINIGNNLYFKGTLNPWMVGMELFSATTIVCGGVGFISSMNKLYSALSDKIVIPSVSKLKIRYWAGLGMMAAGAGIIAGGIADLADKIIGYGITGTILKADII